MINTNASFLKGIPFASTPAGAAAAPEAESIKALGIFGFGSDSAEDKTEIAGPQIPDNQHFRLKNGAEVKGHLASDEQHPNFESSRYPLRTYVQAGNGKAVAVDFRDFLSAVGRKPFPSQRFEVNQSQVDKAINTTTQERKEQLTGSKGLVQGLRAVPKDSTLNPTEFTMYLKNAGDVSTRFAEQLSDIGKIEGFQVLANVSSEAMPKHLAKQGADNVSFVHVPHGEVWAEDYGEPLVGGGRVVPAFIDSSRLVSDAIREGREERFKQHGLDGNFAYHGAVNQGRFQELCLAQGIAEGAPLRQALSYMEGGNIFTGTKADGSGYVLVGKDSFHVTKRLLESETDRKWSDAEVKEAIAADLGIEANAVVAIEQPGAFHLDMRLTSTAPGEILLNDSVQGAEQQIAWMKADLESKMSEMSAKEIQQRRNEIEDNGKQMLENAKLMKRYEDLTAQDLTDAGFVVERTGGSFVQENRANRDTANYFNARHGTNENGERFTIMMGGTPREEAFMAQEVFDKSHGQISHIYFLDPTVTQSTLDLMGGLKCRTKPGGDVVSQQLIQNPNLDSVVAA